MASAIINVDGNLEVVGNPNTPSTINVNSSVLSAVTVTFNGVPATGSPFDCSASDRVIITGGTKNDLIQCAGFLRAEIHGGGGNDRIYCPSADSVVMCETGNVLIVGGSGNDVLVLGAGQCTVQGGSGSDILVAGTAPGTTYDDLRTLGDAFAADPTADLSSLEAAFVPHTSAGISQLSGGVHPNAFFVRSDDLLTDYDATQGDVKVVS